MSLSEKLNGFELKKYWKVKLKLLELSSNFTSFSSNRYRERLSVFFSPNPNGFSQGFIDMVTIAKSEILLRMCRLIDMQCFYVP